MADDWQPMRLSTATSRRCTSSACWRAEAAEANRAAEYSLHERHRLLQLATESAQRWLRRCLAAGAIPVLAVALAGCGGGERARTTTAIRQTGRIGTQESLGGVPVPFAHQEFHVTNMYLGTRGKYSIDVYAGYPPYAPKRGQLRVTWIDNTIGTPDPRRSGTFAPQPPRGALWLSAVKDDVVSFRYLGGTGTFDLKTHEFKLRAG